MTPFPGLFAGESTKKGRSGADLNPGEPDEGSFPMGKSTSRNRLSAPGPARMTEVNFILIC